MGVLLKSVFGLGAVYFAMYGPALKSADVGPTVAVCGAAAQAADGSWRGQAAALGCAAKVVIVAERVAASPPPKPVPPQPAPIPPPAPAKAASGTLTAADMAEPWFGPTPRPQRKSPKRG